MELHNVPQGSPGWLTLRAQPNTFTASEAAAMMSASKYQTRTELMHQKHTGLVPEVDAATQRRFDAGHAAEAAYRPHAEELIGDDLYPCTGSIEIDGLRLLASFDGLTMDRTIDFEHKLFNIGIADFIDQFGEPGPANYWQLEHQMLVSEAKRALFVTSDGTKENAVYCWYESKPERRAALVAGWKQFAIDLAAYQPAPAAPMVVAEPVQALPAVLVQVSGEITVRDNFKAFEVALRDFLEHRLIREPKTDQDFADLDLQIKAMKGAEDALASAESQMLAQVQSIDQAKKTKDMLAKLVRDNRLMAEKLLASEKDRRRGEIVADGITKFREHIEALNKRLGKPYMPAIQADFGGVIKGMKSMTSMENAVVTELARAKIEANAVADRIQVNLNYLAEDVPQGHAFLFADLPTIVLKATDDFRAVVDSRIAAHKEKRERDEAETRERIRKEEQDRLAREAAELAAKEAQRVKDEAYLAGAEQREHERQAEIAGAVLAIRQQNESVAQPASTPTPAANVVPMRTAPRAAAPSTPPTLKLGQIGERLGFNLTGDFLKSLGFEPAARDKAALLFHEATFPFICAALIDHINQVQAKQAA